MNYIYIGNQNNNYKVLKFCILSLTCNDQKDESQQSTKDFGKKIARLGSQNAEPTRVIVDLEKIFLSLWIENICYSL